jgi:hypothetical protein
MKKLFSGVGIILTTTLTIQAQVLISGGNYSQNFDSLPNSGVSAAWTDNTTLLGWYASRATTSSTVSYGPNSYTVMRLDSGANNSGSLYDYGTTADRALGSLASGTPGTNAIGLRIQNDTGSIWTGNIVISYSGEQWRNGGNTTAQNIFSFDYNIYSAGTFPTVIPAHGPGNEPGFTGVASLNFLSPTVGATAGALDGNDPLNRAALSGTLSLSLNPGDELLLRWVDINDAGNDHGGGIDDLTVNFVVPEPQVFSLAGGFGILAFLMRRRK